MSPERIVELTPREREILDELVVIFTEEGFAHLTMASVAAAVRCSLRDLYRIAPNKDDLFVIVVDRLASARGRAALRAIDEDMDALEAVRRYLHVGNELVSVYGERLAADVAEHPRMSERHDTFAAYGVEVVKALLDYAVDHGALRKVNTGALARMLAGTARDFTRPEARHLIGPSARDAANDMADLVIDGLRCQSPTAERSAR
jgi:AcrR family transcriptional regulator